MIRQILKYPDERLRRISEEVAPEEFTSSNDTLNHLVSDMFETMKSDNGIGLAAPQIDVLKRVIVTSLPDSEDMTFVNPKIIATSGSQKSGEGCLSVPGRQVEVKRYKKIRVEFQDLTGEVHVKEFQGLQSACIQHEIDHLDGVLLVDHIKKVKLYNFNQQ